jgi:carboxyl-terminal processing protease
MVAGSKSSTVQRFPVRTDRRVSLPALQTLPMVVVVNGETAAGGEIVAGALQLRQRAVIVGTATRALGEIDTIVPIARLGAVRFTTGRVYLPGIYPLHEVGVAPTVCLASASGGNPAQAIGTGLRTMAPYAGRPRAQLSLDERAAAHKACPGSPREPALELAVAEYLARDADAYRRALDTLPANPPAPGE